jgi:succinyl-diaminopimelate desuccinylase
MKRTEPESVLTSNAEQVEAKIKDLASALIRCPSVTPADEGCQKTLRDELIEAGFKIEDMRFGQIENFWATHGKGAPTFVFAGHTDVVPAGSIDQWQTPPFTPTVKDGLLFGRGAADMKGNLAAMALAASEFIKRHPQHKGTVALLITGDEEALAEDGTAKVVERLLARGEKITWCVVGEPSSAHKLGDTIKIGRRGSLSGSLIVHGVQGHVAYPERALNPIHNFASALAELCAIEWDHGNEYFPPTSFQVSNIRSGTGAENVIPDRLEASFNFRFSTESRPDSLRMAVEKLLEKHNVQFEINWRLSGQPFLTYSGKLLGAARNSVKKIIGIEPELSTSGGTSDGRFIAQPGTEVIELGPLNASIHKLDESISIKDLVSLYFVYLDMMETLLT